MTKKYATGNRVWRVLPVALLAGACAQSTDGGGAPPPVAGVAAVKAELGSRVLPAEFAPQESLWLAWPTYENVAGRPTEVVHRAIIKALAPYVKIDLLAQNNGEINAIKNDLTSHGVPVDHVRFHPITHTDVWMRDMGPFFVKDGEAKSVVGWQFNGWGYAKYSKEMAKFAPIDDVVDAAIADRLDLPLVPSTMTMEGGTLESNGLGTLMTSEPVVFERNPQFHGSRAAADEEFKRVLGVKKVVWLPKGVVDDESTWLGPLPVQADSTDHPTGTLRRPYTVITTGGHIDEYARFVGPRKVLLAEVTAAEASADPVAALNKPRLDEDYAALQAQTDQDGKPFDVVRIPMPEPIYYEQKPGDGVYDFLAKLQYLDGSVFPAGQPILTIEANSYLNFIITNGAVLVPKFWKPGRPEVMRDKDEQAADIIQSVFPGRKVIPIDAENVNLGGGGMHCIVYQQPR